jgi:hypothetical protein
MSTAITASPAWARATVSPGVASELVTLDLTETGMREEDTERGGLAWLYEVSRKRQ